MSEVLIEKATMHNVGVARGLTAHICRLSNITGPDTPELDLIHNILRASRVSHEDRAEDVGLVGPI